MADISKVVYGDRTLIDLTSDTVTADDMAEGVTAHDASGKTVTGVLLKTTVDDALSDTSESPVQNKVVTEALNTKADADTLANVSDTLSAALSDVSDTLNASVASVTESGGVVTVTTNGGETSTFEAGDPKSIVAVSSEADKAVFTAKDGTSTTVYKDTVAQAFTTVDEERPILMSVSPSLTEGNVGTVDKSKFIRVNPSTGDLICGTVNGVDVTALAKESDLSAYAKSAGLAAVATSGDYSDLSGTPAEATSTSAGLMSTAMYSKLDSIEDGAEKNEINSISLNGTALAITANRNVDIDISDYAKTVDLESYVQAKDLPNSLVSVTNGTGKATFTAVDGTSTEVLTNKVKSSFTTGTVFKYHPCMSWGGAQTGELYKCKNFIVDMPTGDLTCGKINGIDVTTLSDGSDCVKLTGAQTVGGAKTFSTAALFNDGATFTGTAAEAGLKTRGVSGLTADGTKKDALYLNYDGNESYSRKVYLGGQNDGAMAVRKDMLTWANLLSKPTTVSGYGITDAYTKTETDTAVSNAVSAIDLSPYATNDSVESGLAKKANTADVYTKDEVDERVSSIPKFDIEVVETLPESGDATTVYLVKTSDDVENLYTEYIYVNNAWEELGVQGTDLSGYLPLTGGTLTGTLTGTSIVAENVQTGSADANYFQCRKFRGEGNANTYYHAIDFGYANHDQVDFYEYGGIWNFWKNTSASKGGTKVGAITTTGWNGDARLSGSPTAPTPTTGDSSTRIATTAFVSNAITNAAPDLTDYYTKSEVDTKIDGVKITVDDAISETSENPVQNKAIYAELSDFSSGFKTYVSGELTPYAKSADLANVATSGSYNDLTDKPDIAAAYTLPTATSTTLGGIKVGTGLTVTTDGTLSASGVSVDLSPYAKIVDLATVATTGSYNDLADTPTIPDAVKVDATMSSTSENPVQNKVVYTQLAAKVNTTTYDNEKKNFAKTNTANNYSGEQKFTNASYCPSVSDSFSGIGCAQKASRLMANQVLTGQIVLPNVNGTNANNSIDNVKNTLQVQYISTVHSTKPTLTNIGTITPEKGWDGLVKGIDVSTLATKDEVSGIDLSAYAKTADLSAVAMTGDYGDLTGTPTTISGYGITDVGITDGTITIGDSSITPITEHQSLAGYLKTDDAAATYFKSATLSGTDLKFQYGSNTWKTVGLSSLVSGYAKKTDIPTVPTNVSAFTNDAGYLTEHQDLSGYAKTTDLASVATSGSYEDLTDTPTIDTALSSTSTNPVQNKVVNTAISSAGRTTLFTVGSATTDYPIAVCLYTGTSAWQGQAGKVMTAKVNGATGNITCGTVNGVDVTALAKTADIAENPVTDVTESGGTVTVTKYDGTESTFEAGDPKSIVSVTATSSKATFTAKDGTTTTFTPTTNNVLQRRTTTTSYLPVLLAGVYSDYDRGIADTYYTGGIEAQPSTGNITCGTVNGVDVTALATKASPAFTGTPTAPTASAGTSTTQIATTAFVMNAINTALAAYAKLSGATFTGNISAPTVTATTSVVVPSGTVK